MEAASYRFGMASALVFTLVVCAYFALINFFSQYSHIYLLQEAVARAVYHIQSLIGISVELQGSKLIYPGLFQLDITLLCTGINEALLFSMALTAFIGVSLRTKALGLAVFLPVLIAENLLRIAAIEPLARLLGEGTALGFHNLLFRYGQMAFVIILVMVWFYCFARKEFIASVRNYRQAMRSRTR